MIEMMSTKHVKWKIIILILIAAQKEMYENWCASDALAFCLYAYVCGPNLYACETKEA
jgi:hypothetical protein